MKQGVKLLIVIGLAFVAAFAGAKAYRWQQQNQRIIAEYAGYTAGDFTLQGIDGDVSLHDFKGRVVLIYFGYSFCPDVCPTSLALMGEAMRLLEGEADVKGLLISVDPERDTPEKLEEYAKFFHPEMSGLTASPPRILEVSTRYNAYYKKVEREGQDYLVDHTSRTYLIDQEGKLAGVFRHATPPEEIVERVSGVL